ncbi:hypothetical protein [Aquimarina algiphila]|uniref:Uncharacterized protein n=1 Tax=Aquimarina algiphila TaxID=2047982 RepID=A0A554VJ26_9FLAO|nr:hypothetical protein [Aquimarina algiphila]TSE07893.1 hypothetical protein FOF46_14295 [Aquimarina algiphila]
MRYIIATIILCILSSCDSSKNKSNFQLEELVSKIITKNAKCNEILTKHFSIDPEDIRSYNFIDGISYRIANELENNDNLKRVLLIRTYDKGEVVISNSFSVLIFQNGKTLISKHIKGKALNTTSNEVEQFELEKFYSYLNQKGEIDIKGRKNILVIDFDKKDSCKCSVYSDFSLKELKEYNENF